MVAFEVFLIFAFALFIFAGFTAVVKMITSDHSGRFKGHSGELGVDEQNLKNRVSALEDEIRDLKTQMVAIQESSEFAIRMIESERDKTS